ncbi:hypothetical protein INR49_001853, partial [Caranx melampygus]
PKASGHIFTITDFRPEHSGNYYCEAQNTRGRHKSTLNLTVVVPGSLTSAAAGTITVFLLVLVLLAVFLWIRRDELFTQQCEQGERPDTGAELNMGPVYESPSWRAGQQDELHYACVNFPQNQGDPVYSNITVYHQRETVGDEEDEDSVEYSVVRFNKARSDSQARWEEEGMDPFALYSTTIIALQSCQTRAGVTITDLRESDSAVYKLSLTTNKAGEKHTGEAGVTLSVTVTQRDERSSDEFNSSIK